MRNGDATKNAILDSVRYHFSRQGSNGVGMRTIAHNVSIAPSVLYHYFPDKESLLQAMYEREVKALGQQRKQALSYTSFEDSLNELIEFQFNHSESIVAVLKYYFSHRSEFAGHDDGFLPPRSTRHVQELLECASSAQHISTEDVSADAHVLTHTINGYLLEYFPDAPTPSQLDSIKSQIRTFAQRSLRPSAIVTNSQGGL